jgi:hypothetical protein
LAFKTRLSGGFFVGLLYNKFMNLITQIFLPKPALAQTQVWSGRCVSDGVATIQGFECLFQNILVVIFGIAGLTFLAMFIVGGFKYLTSGGDSKKTAAASATLTYAVIGVVGIIISWLVLLFIEQFTGIKVTIFKIGS